MSLQSKEVRLGPFLGFSILRFFPLPLCFFGLVCCAAHSFGFLSAPMGRVSTLWELFLANQEGSLM